MNLGKLCMQAPWVPILFAVLAAAVVLLALELKRARAREEKEDREIRSILSAMEELYPLAVFADIKRNRVRFIRHHGLREGEDPGISYDDFISVGAEDTPAGEARDRFLSVFCRDAMLKAIEDGKKHLTLDTPHMMQDGQYHWMRCLHIFLNPEKKDGQTLILASVIDREIAERQEQERVNAIQESVIESLATLVESRDINTGSHVRNTRRLVTLIVEKLRETGEFPELLDDKGIPRCRNCRKKGENFADGLGRGPIIKPDVVLYEEGLDEHILYESVHELEQADMLIVGGTSLNVYPAAGLLRYFSGRYLVLINKQPTQADRSADLVIREPIGEVLSKIQVS